MDEIQNMEPCKEFDKRVHELIQVWDENDCWSEQYLSK